MKISERVSITNLRENLCRYIRRAKRGRPVIITKRGESIAILIPAQNHPDAALARELRRKGVGSWTGSKPKGASRRIAVKGRPVSKLVLEERR